MAWGPLDECERRCARRVELEAEILGESTVSFEECVKLCKSALA